MERKETKLPSLTTPLIRVTDINEVQDGNGPGLEKERQTEKKAIAIDERKEAAAVGEVKKQLWLAGPLICVNLLQFCLQLISIMFVGHLGELPLSGASMASSFASVTGFSLLVSWDFLQINLLVRCGIAG